MGGSSSKLEIKEWHNSGSQIEQPDVIDQQLKETRAELSQQKPLITENVIQQLMLREDSMVLKYSELKNAAKVSEHIEEIFKDENALWVLTDAAKKMAKVFQTSGEMTKLLRWNQVQKVTKCGDKTVGMELHYKVVIIEEAKGVLAKVGRGTTETVVILGYKFIVHALDVDPAEIPDEANLKALRF